MLLPEAADAHYAGKGVKRDAKDRPIFWYQPEGAKKYRVIYADLAAGDAKPHFRSDSANVFSFSHAETILSTRRPRWDANVSIFW